MRSAALLLAFSLGLPAGRAFPRTFSLLFRAQLVLLTSTLALLVAWSVAFGATAITGWSSCWPPRWRPSGSAPSCCVGG